MYIIYRPKGKAAEYSPWAANFYNGCSNRCETILTKRKEVVEYLRRLGWDILRLWTMKRYLKVGFTLTGRDDLEQALSLFGAQFNENIEKNVEIARKAGFDSVFSSLPDVFCVHRKNKVRNL